MTCHHPSSKLTSVEHNLLDAAWRGRHSQILRKLPKFLALAVWGAGIYFLTLESLQLLKHVQHLAYLDHVTFRSVLAIRTASIVALLISLLESAAYLFK